MNLEPLIQSKVCQKEKNKYSILAHTNRFQKNGTDLPSRVHHEKRWAGGSTSWNQDCGRNINNLRYADNTTLVAESEKELKSLLMKVKEESENIGLKPNIQKTKIMASSPITSWQIDGETVETVADFNFGGSKITADGDCSHEIKRRLLLGRKVMTNLDRY